MRIKKTILLIIVILLISSSAACSKKNQNKIIDKPDKQQYMTMAVPVELKTLDVNKVEDSYTSQIVSEIFEGLTRPEQDKSGKILIKPAGAESWDVSENGLVWTFHIRDYNWSDGKKVTASDYVYGIKRSLNPSNGSKFAYLLAPISGADEYNNRIVGEQSVGVKAKDDKTLQIRLERPCPYFLNLTYLKIMMPVRKDIVDKYKESYGADSSKSVFNGPFTVKRWENRNSMELEKNENYWDSKNVILNNISIKVIKGQDDELKALQDGIIDLAIGKPEWSKKIKNASKFDIIKDIEPSVSYEFFNQKDKLFGNADIRKAFSAALDREDIVKDIYNEAAVPAYSWCPPGIQISGDDFRKKSNYEPVKKLIEEEKDPRALLIKGLKEVGADSNPSNNTISILQIGSDIQSKEFTDYFKNMWEKNLGVKISVKYVDWNTFQNNIENMKYQMAGMIWNADYNDPLSQFDMWSSEMALIPTGWTDKKYDSLIEKARTTKDQDARFKAFKDAENILVYEDAVVAPIAYRQKDAYKYKYIKNAMFPGVGTGIELKYACVQGRAAR